MTSIIDLLREARDHCDELFNPNAEASASNHEDLLNRIDGALRDIESCELPPLPDPKPYRRKGWDWALRCALNDHARAAVMLDRGKRSKE